MARRKDPEPELDDAPIVVVPPSEIETEVRERMRSILQEGIGRTFQEDMYPEDRIDLYITDVKPKERPAIALGLWYARHFNQPWLTDLILDDLALRGSHAREGRKEY